MRFLIDLNQALNDARNHSQPDRVFIDRLQQNPELCHVFTQRPPSVERYFPSKLRQFDRFRWIEYWLR
tara:strand:- start:94 stop:297 length:204 start_codon:yes stop_codon:yes gene_type:complete